MICVSPNNVFYHFDDQNVLRGNRLDNHGRHKTNKKKVNRSIKAWSPAFVAMLVVAD